jgi:hypothetical protein
MKFNLIHFYALASNFYFIFPNAQGVLDGYKKIDEEV